MNDNLFSKSYFEIFELPQRFIIDSCALNEKYRILQKIVHPDRYAGAGAAERRLSMQQTSLINQAYQTLLQPVERAKYMMTLVTRAISDSAKPVDSEFLMEQMELREALSAIRAQADPLRSLNEVNTRIGHRMDAELIAFDVFYKDHQFDSASSSVDKMQFLQKALHEMDELTIDLEDELMD